MGQHVPFTKREMRELRELGRAGPGRKDKPVLRSFWGVDCPVRMNNEYISYRDNYGGILKLVLVRKVSFAIYSLHIIIIILLSSDRKRKKNRHDEKREKQRKQQKEEKQGEGVKGGMRESETTPAICCLQSPFLQATITNNKP